MRIVPVLLQVGVVAVVKLILDPSVITTVLVGVQLLASFTMTTYVPAATCKKYGFAEKFEPPSKLY